MFLHIGGVYYITIESIICIFDINKSDEFTVQKFMEKARSENRLIYACNKEDACSAVVSKKDGKNCVYISSASVVSLSRRRHRALKSIYGKAAK